MWVRWFNKRIFFIGILTISLCSFAQDNSTTLDRSYLLSQSYFTTDFKMGGVSFSEGQDESQLVQLQIRPKATINFNEDFSVFADAALILNSSRTQTRYQNPNFNIINLMELVASYHPSSFFNLEAGAINQEKHLNNRLLVADRAFPGVKVSSGIDNKKIKIKGKLQYAIPTSTSFEDDRVEAESLPSFQTEGIELKWSPRSWFDLTADVNHFRFNELPSVVAHQSGNLGNQVVGTDPSESYFVYEFEGFSQAYILGLNYGSGVSQELEIGIVENVKAPEARRRSQWVGTRLGLDFKDIKVSPRYALFFAESDSAPAVYSAFELGRNNRDGEFMGLQLDFKKMGFSLHTNYIQSELIKFNAPQANMNYLEMVLEVENVSL